MKITLFGATGMIGQRIAAEAVERGHEVTGITRHPEKIENPKVKGVAGDVTDPASIAAAVTGADVVIASINPSDYNPAMFTNAAHALIAGLKQAGVQRLIVVGGAGSLFVAPGVRRVDSPDFPEAWRPLSRALGEALEIYRQSGNDLDWTFISPADVIQPGERTGKYRTGKDDMLYDDKGESKISAEDYAIGLMDEVENHKHPRERITFGY